MLLHKPAVSQCGLYKIKQTAFSTWYGTKRERENKRLAALAYGRKTALALGPVCVRSICECVCGCLCATLFDFSTLWPHVPLRIASLAAKPKPGKLASRSGIMVELKCPRPKMSIYVIWKTKLTPAQTWRGWYELQKTLLKKQACDKLRHADGRDSPQLLQRELQNAYKVNGKSLNVFGIQH